MTPARRRIKVPANLLDEKLGTLDSHELRLLLDARIGGPGQYDGRVSNPNRFCLPQAGEACRVVLTFRDNQIVLAVAGPAFDQTEWQRIREEIETSILLGPTRVGRDYSFSSFRVQGSWRGDRSRVQILAPPDDAPRADIEMTEHPFILEFPIQEASIWPITNHRRMREHRNLTLLLNVLLAGRTSLLPRRQDHFWAHIPGADGQSEFKWLQNFYFATLGEAVNGDLSEPTGKLLAEVEPQEYYSSVGHDGKGLRVPADLDLSIYLYRQLTPTNRARFDRATFWIDMAARLWNTSFSASFAARVAAIESLTERGTAHAFPCPVCGKDTHHEVPGPTRLFRDFFETYARGTTLRKRHDAMYSLRSGIVHGSALLQLDLDRDFGWDPPGWKEYELHVELSSLTRIAVRNWLKSPPA